MKHHGVFVSPWSDAGRPVRQLFALGLVAGLAACGGGGGGGGGDATVQGNGTLRVALTDAPACGYDAVNVTVQKVRVNKSANADDNDANWSEVVLAQPKRVDLLKLTNGALEELGQTSLPAGKYTQMRLVLAPNTSANPLANSVTPTGSGELPLGTPSGQQSGLKSNIDIDVAANQTADFVIDFHVCQSIVRRGNSGQFNLKPVLSMLPRLTNAAVVGYVSPFIATSATTVSVQLNGVPVRSTPPDTSGKFVLSPVPVGTYDLVVNAPGRVLAVLTGVPVAAGAPTNVNADTNRIDPPPATLRNASGKVTTGVDPIDASVRATKALAGGPTVEVGNKPVDSLTGAYTFPLPVDAAVRAAYAAGAQLPTFVADTASPTGKYTLTATSGSATKSLDVDLTTTAATEQNFVFP